MTAEDQLVELRDLLIANNEYLRSIGESLDDIQVQLDRLKPTLDI